MVATPASVVTDDRLADRGFWRPDLAPRLHRAGVVTAGPPFTIDGERPAWWRGAPDLFEDTAAVLRDVLDYEADTINSLAALGAVVEAEPPASGRGEKGTVNHQPPTGPDDGSCGRVVEHGPTVDVIADPKHPYTRMLVRVGRRPPLRAGGRRRPPTAPTLSSRCHPSWRPDRAGGPAATSTDRRPEGRRERRRARRGPPDGCTGTADRHAGGDGRRRSSTPRPRSSPARGTRRPTWRTSPRWSGCSRAASTTSTRRGPPLPADEGDPSGRPRHAGDDERRRRERRGPDAGPGPAALREAGGQHRLHRVFYHEFRHLTGERYVEIVSLRETYERYVVDLITEGQAAGEFCTRRDAHVLMLAVLTLLNSVQQWYRRRVIDMGHLTDEYAAFRRRRAALPAAPAGAPVDTEPRRSADEDVASTWLGEPRDVMKLEDGPAPEARPGEVLIEVHAAALQFPDLLQLRGGYQVKPALPFTMGGEIAGRVVAVGDGVTSVAAGDAVAASASGGLAEMAVTKATRCTR